MKLLVIGSEYCWIQYFDDVMVVPRLEEIQYEMALDGTLTIIKDQKKYSPDIVLFRRIPVLGADKFFVKALRNFKGKVVNNPQAMEKANDLYRCLCMLRKAGLKVPETTLFQGTKACKGVFPAVIKISGEHRGNGKALVKNESEFKEAANLLVDPSREYLLQEYLEGRDVRVLVLGKEVIGAVSRTSEDWKKNTESRVNPTYLTEELKETALKAAKAIDAELAGIDIIETEKGFYILEINTEPGIEYFGDEVYKKIAKYIG